MGQRFIAMMLSIDTRYDDWRPMERTIFFELLTAAPIEPPAPTLRPRSRPSELPRRCVSR
jgi:hypothetical protein